MNSNIIKLNKEDLSIELQFLLDFGLIIIDKPSNLTSHQVSDIVSKMLDVKKAGHSGTLDPKVTGVLPVALNKATRIMEFLLKSSKTYITIMHLHQPTKIEDLQKVINENFLGKISQLPPVKCAVKRAYRTREIFSIKILDVSSDNKDYLMEVKCEAGTYIRKLLHDIGKELGVGAHMHELRRTKSGDFTESDLVTLEDLEDAIVLANEGNEKELIKIIKPLKIAATKWDKIEVLKKDMGKVLNGMLINYPNEFTSEVALILKDKLIGFGRNVNNKYIRPFRVYYDKQTYEKYLK